MIFLFFTLFFDKIAADVSCTGTTDTLDVDDTVVSWTAGCTQTCGSGVQLGTFRCYNTFTGEEECTDDCIAQNVRVRTYQYCNTNPCDVETNDGSGDQG